ncbi:hypothetical protein [uncultured Aquitalea sp.]|uniref:hypothetical protein n=1 Tax=uncultured Aquitalea sp. TaxID=540272 RepID=UPI0025FFEE15|nr:hypothetical protein [uncultured Aquitalea sp.]
MDNFAMVLGFSIMAIGGATVFALLCYFIHEWMLEKDTARLNAQCLREAIKEWKANHPEKWAAMKKRNGQAE